MENNRFGIAYRECPYCGAKFGFTLVDGEGDESAFSRFDDRMARGDQGEWCCGGEDAHWAFIDIEDALDLLPIPKDVLPEFCLRAYQLGINPLPKLRDALQVVPVKYFIKAQGTAYTADGPCLAVWVEYDQETDIPIGCRVDFQVEGDILWTCKTE